MDTPFEFNVVGGVTISVLIFLSVATTFCVQSLIEKGTKRKREQVESTTGESPQTDEVFSTPQEEFERDMVEPPQDSFSPAARFS